MSVYSTVSEIHRRERMRARFEEGFRDRLHYDAGLDWDSIDKHCSVDRYYVEEGGRCGTELKLSRLPAEAEQKYLAWLAGFRAKAPFGGPVAITPFSTASQTGLNLTASDERAFVDFLSEHVLCRPLEFDTLEDPGSAVRKIEEKRLYDLKMARGDFGQRR